MYYLRKLSSLSTPNKIKCAGCVADVPADLLKQELPTKYNTLSFWKFESFDCICDSIIAAILAGTSIGKTKFIIADDSLMDEYNLKCDYSELGETGYIGYDNMHVNVCELTYGKIGDVLRMMKAIIEKEEYLYELQKDDVKRLIKQAYTEGKVNQEKMHDQLVSDIVKYGLNSK